MARGPFPLQRPERPGQAELVTQGRCRRSSYRGGLLASRLHWVNEMERVQRLNLSTRTHWSKRCISCTTGTVMRYLILSRCSHIRGYGRLRRATAVPFISNWSCGEPPDPRSQPEHVENIFLCRLEVKLSHESGQALHAHLSIATVD